MRIVHPHAVANVRKLFFPAQPDKVGVLPFRIRDGEVEVLLITSRGRSRWLIPKGGIQPGFGPRGSARNEAYEEAGVAGPIGSKPVGCYRHGRAGDAPLVQVFLMRVEQQADSWPEQDQRRCRWLPLDEAIDEVALVGLQAILEEAGTLLRMAASAGPSAKRVRHPVIPPGALLPV